jgi:hypothetical protein
MDLLTKSFLDFINKYESNLETCNSLLEKFWCGNCDNVEDCKHFLSRNEIMRWSSNIIPDPGHYSYCNPGVMPDFDRTVITYLENFILFDDSTLIPNKQFKYFYTNSQDTCALLFIFFYKRVTNFYISSRKHTRILYYFDENGKKNETYVRYKCLEVAKDEKSVIMSLDINNQEYNLVYDLESNKILYDKDCIYFNNSIGVRAPNYSNLISYSKILDQLDKYSNTAFVVREILTKKLLSSETLNKDNKIGILRTKYRNTYYRCIMTLMLISLRKEKVLIKNFPQELALIICSFLMS